MTDKEKLQQLFNAALQGGSDFDKPPTRAFPQSRVACVTAAPVAAPAPEEVAVAEVTVPAPAPRGGELVEPMPNAGLDDETSTELGKLLDEQHARVTRRRRREMMVTLLVLFGLTGGGFGWFVSSPARVTAFKSAMTEIRSVGDIKGMLAKYQVALDKIGTRGADIDDASMALGVDPSTVVDDDPYMEAETEAFTGEVGTGVGARNKKFQEKFGKLVKSPLMAGKNSVPEGPGGN
jgi:hypothetical protein